MASFLTHQTWNQKAWQKRLQFVMDLYAPAVLHGKVVAATNAIQCVQVVRQGACGKQPFAQGCQCWCVVINTG